MTATCSYCSSRAQFYLQATDLNQKTDDATFNYYRCANCWLIFLDPIPENLSDYYHTGRYEAYRIPDSLEELARLEKKLHWRVELVRRYKNTGNMLEIGSSFGAFAYGAQQAGFRVDAIEMDKNCCNFINSTTDVSAINTQDITETMAANKKMYDAIAIWHGIEHFTDPWAVLKQCSLHLATGGVLVISTPNPDSIQFRFFKKYWVHLDAPRHVELIPPALLRSFLKKVDMELVYKTTTDPDGLNLNAMGWFRSTVHLFRASSEGSVARKIVARSLRLMLFPFERWWERGAAYTVIYRKK